MSGSVDRGSSSQHDEGLLPPSSEGVSTSSGTAAYVHNPNPVEPPESSQLSVNDGDRTVISQRPVAAPEEFYRSMPLSELAAMLEGRQLDHFAVEQMIGGGGMGAVFRGRDLRLDRIVAIKVIPASRRDAETLRRFRLEAQAAAKLDHPNIARVYYVGEAEQWNYIVFEFIDGVNIRDLVEMEGPLSVDDAVFYTRQVAEALQHAHEREVVHRDIKPSNILVTAAGSAKVVDMGLARNTALDKSTADATASGVTLGTFDYISPEQAKNPRDADVRSDLYSLGCTLFYMLTGNAPFPEGTALQKLLSHGSQPPPDPRGWRDDISDELYEVTMKLMAKRPGDRYQKPAELISDLIMLAEVEDLPRSQSPGTLLVAPNIAQSSLLETNLPWLVALAFLLGSTLWLQSVQSLSNDFEIEKLKFDSREISPISVESKTDQPETGDVSLRSLGETSEPLPTQVNGAGIALPQAEVDRTSIGASLVVSSELPADVDPGRWETSLTRALQRLSATGNQEIELRGRNILRTPLFLNGQGLRLRSGAGVTAVLEIDDAALLGVPENGGMFSLADSKLELRGIAVEVMLPADKPIGRQSLFAVRGTSQIELDNCAITVRDRLETDRYCVISCNDEAGYTNLTPTRLASATETVAGEAAILRASMCLFRGNTSLIRVNTTKETLDNRTEITLTNTLVAVTGSAVRITAPTGDFQTQRFVRMLCDQSTFVTDRSFAEIEYTGGLAPLVGLIRTSQNCVYWSQPTVPHVAISGARRQSVLGNFNLLLLQGWNNLYDANVENICQAYLNGETVATFGFAEALTSGWLGERGNESRIRWQEPDFPKLPLSEATPGDFTVADVLFVPGIAPDLMPSPAAAL